VCGCVGLRAVWRTSKKHLKALEDKIAEEGMILSDSHVATLEKKNRITKKPQVR
jgi:hypothetical protein